MNNILLALFFSLVLFLSLFYSLSLYSPPQLQKNITTISSLCFSNITEHIKVVTKDQYINYRDKNWMSDIDDRINQVKKKQKYISDEKKAYQYPQFVTGYSSFNYYEVDNPFGTAKSFTLLLFSNVCFKLSDMQFYLYTENVSLMQQRLKKCGYFSEFSPVISDTLIPDGYYVKTEHNWMIKHFQTSNIGHYIEVMNYLHHYFHNMDTFPTISNLFLPRYNKATNEWKQAYYNVTMNLLRSVKSIDVYTYERMKEISRNQEGFMCFKQIGFSSRLNSIGYGGVFIYSYECDLLRGLMYKRYNIDPSSLPQSFNIVFIKRSSRRPRMIANEKELLDMFSYIKSTRLLPHSLIQIMFEELPFAKQLEVITHSDVFVGVVGSSSINMIYMVPHSVVISAMPAYQTAEFFETLARLTRIQYVTLFNTTAPIISDCKDYITSIGQVKSNIECHWAYYNAAIYIPPGQLYNQLILARDYVNFYKYHHLD